MGRATALVSPRARALLVRLGYSVEDAAGIAGSGPGGRVVDRDVTAWAEARSGTQPVSTDAVPGGLTVTGTIPLRGRRGTIAERMTSSLQTAAQLTSVLELDVKPLVELRRRLNEEGASPRIGVTSIVVRLVAAALREHPLLNARVTETDVELLAEINIAVAVETPDGLVAPVVHHADRLSLEEVNARITGLAQRAREDALTPDDVGGGTFTVSNGGIHPVDITTAILNPPQCGILWIGRVRDRPVVVGDGGDRRPADAPGLSHLRPPGGRRRPGRGVPLHLRGARRRPAAVAVVSADEGAAIGTTAETRRKLHRTMLTIRLFEQRVAREFRTGEIPGFVHMYVGEEAVAAGVCANLDDDDYVTSTHRGHGHCIAKGCDLDGMMAEIYGREDGLCKGRGGSMHIADFSRGMLGANAIVGGGIALATGAGLAASVRGSGQVAVAFFGDGAANQGVLHESLNLAAIWKLPVLYVCENNGFAESTPAAYATSVPDVASRAAGYGIPGVVVDGADALAVYGAARTAVERARAGEGPTLLEVKTYRFMGHFEGDPDRYRDRRGTRGPAPVGRAGRAARRPARRGRRDRGRPRGGAGRARRRGRSGGRVRAREPDPRPGDDRATTCSRSRLRRRRCGDGGRDRAQALDGQCDRRGDAPGDGGRPGRDRDGRGRGRRRRARRVAGEHDGRLVRRDQEPLSALRARSGCATRRSRRRASSAPASEPRPPGCARSST